MYKYHLNHEKLQSCNFPLQNMVKAVSEVSLQKWFRIALFNLLLVAFIGIILRYKIAFSLPFINQKYLLNTHSHFAFAGWVSQALMTLITSYLNKYSSNISLKKYRYLLLANLITAYGMLLSFPFQGYALISIIFSTLSIFTVYVFAIIVWRDLNKIPIKTVSHLWIKASLIFYLISSFGSFALAYMMANKIIHQNWYVAAVYFFLHFQYNGWFFFTCMGLLADKLNTQIISTKLQKIVFYLFSFACIPAYFLSVLWLPIFGWVYALVILAAFAQVAGWFILLKKLIKNHQLVFTKTPNAVKYIWTLSAIALSIKLLLQLGSTIPALSSWAFGFRPVVIGYLHLILLGVITLFIIGYAIHEHYILLNKNAVLGIWIFIAGIILNELLLMLQGFGAIKYKSIPYVNELLLAAACIMFFGILMMNIANRKASLD